MIEWWPNAVMPFEIAPDEPIVGAVQGASADVGRPGRLGGLDSWYDGIPANCVSVAHMIDEFVPVDGLVSAAQGLAVAAMRFCGVPD